MTAERDHANWRRVEDVMRPSADELSQTERELVKLRTTALPPGQVEHIVRRATREYVGKRSPTRQQRRVLLVAGTALLMLSLGWVGGVVWPRQPRQPRTEFAQAVSVARSATSAREDWRRAMRTLTDGCRNAIDALAKLRLDADSEVARSAAAAHDRLAARLSAALVTNLHRSMTELTGTALAPSAPRTNRLAAIADLELAAAVGLTAIRQACESTPDSIQIKAALVRKAEANLPRPSTPHQR